MDNQQATLRSNKPTSKREPSETIREAPKIFSDQGGERVLLKLIKH